MRTVFNESQRFNQTWVWLLLIIIATFGISLPLIELSDTEAANKRVELTIVLGFIAIAMGLAITLIATAKLETRIDDQGIHYKFTPFIWSWKLIPAHEIQSAEVMKYNPILDYGGWGYRFSLRGKGRALNIRGNNGIFVVRKNGKKLMLGTQKPEEASRALKQMFDQEPY